MAKVIEDRELQRGTIKNDSPHPVAVYTYERVGDYRDGPLSVPLYARTSIIVSPGRSAQIIADAAPESRNT